jgi:hypothetical protein
MKHGNKNPTNERAAGLIPLHLGLASELASLYSSTNSRLSPSPTYSQEHSSIHEDPDPSLVHLLLSRLKAEGDAHGCFPLLPALWRAHASPSGVNEEMEAIVGPPSHLMVRGDW